MRLVFAPLESRARAKARFIFAGFLLVPIRFEREKFNSSPSKRQSYNMTAHDYSSTTATSFVILQKCTTVINDQFSLDLYTVYSPYPHLLTTQLTKKKRYTIRCCGSMQTTSSAAL